MTGKPQPTETAPAPDAAAPGKPEAPASDATNPFDPSVVGDAGGGEVSADIPYDPSMMGDPTEVMAMMAPFIGVVLIVGLLIAAFSIFCWWRIFSKAGHPGALSLVFIAGIIPLIGPLICLGLFIWFAFAEWPIERQARGEPAQT